MPGADRGANPLTRSIKSLIAWRISRGLNRPSFLIIDGPQGGVEFVGVVVNPDGHDLVTGVRPFVDCGRQLVPVRIAERGGDVTDQGILGGAACDQGEYAVIAPHLAGVSVTGGDV